MFRMLRYCGQGLSAEAHVLIEAAGCGRHAHRDRVLIAMIHLHGLRVGELLALRWNHVDLLHGKFQVERLKKGVCECLLEWEEIAALRKLQRNYRGSPYVFCSEKGTPLSYCSANQIIARAKRVSFTTKRRLDLSLFEPVGTDNLAYE